MPLNEGAWEQRRFYTVDLVQQDPTDTASRFMEFLSKENIATGAALASAERIYKSQKKRSILREAIPKAWKKIVSEPDGLLVELVIETTERICGFRPEDTEVKDFLRDHIEKPPAGVPEPIRRQRPTPERRSIPASPTSTDYTGKRIERFVFLGRRYDARNWQDLLMIVATQIYERHGRTFDEQKGRRLRQRGYATTIGIQSCT